ncbi:hypothetical protein H5400_02160 [Rhodococcus wratislaviensis]|nr:hypothetical protein [Rhodococcus sp. 3A]MBC2897514.1 hypothetical protein [Rhodococcus sp. 4CII]
MSPIAKLPYAEASGGDQRRDRAAEDTGQVVSETGAGVAVPNMEHLRQ